MQTTTQGKSLNEWQEIIGAWAEATFQHNASGIAKHLIREAVELAQACGLSEEGIILQEVTQMRRPNKKPEIGEEAADVLILILALAYHLGFDLSDALIAKHVVNKHRTWGTPDVHGVSEHA